MKNEIASDKILGVYPNMKHTFTIDSFIEYIYHLDMSYMPVVLALFLSSLAKGGNYPLF